jgi:hypothetical protein
MKAYMCPPEMKLAINDYTADAYKTSLRTKNVRKKLAL